MTDERPGNDFKYIIQDLYRLYFGAKCTYSEIMESDETYTRFKALCRNYLITEVDKDTTLESHFYYMSPTDRAAEVYTSLGARVRVNVPTVKPSFFAKITASTSMPSKKWRITCVRSSKRFVSSSVHH